MKHHLLISRTGETACGIIAAKASSTEGVCKRCLTLARNFKSDEGMLRHEANISTLKSLKERIQ